MARGGSRKGAGRKLGSATTKTREIADRASKSGVVPLEVMLDAMRFFHGKAGEPNATADIAMTNYRLAADIAKDAAPYMHPKLASIEHTNGEDGPFQIIISPTQAEY